MKNLHLATILALHVLLTVGCMSRDKSSEAQATSTVDEASSQNSTLAADPTIQQKRNEYRDAMQEIVEIYRREYLSGTGSIEQLIAAQMDLTKAELAFAATSETRVDVLRRALENLKVLEQEQEDRQKVGMARPEELAKAKAGRIQCELALLEENAKLAK